MTTQIEVWLLDTRRLYWEEPFSSEFEARMVGAVDLEGCIGVILDATLFHPEGGGQPSDRGNLSLLSGDAVAAFGQSDLEVVDVRVVDGGIIHLLSTSMSAAGFPNGIPAVPAGGWKLKGKIDWDFRFDLMQQHTGQHILSRAFEEILDAHTVGFHLGKDYVSIDLDIQSLSAADKERVEERANRIVFAGLPVTAKDYAKGELPAEIRTRLPIDAERVRVISVGDFDACACAGTHVTNSGQVGLIKVNLVDRAHGGVRVIFRCGKRALADYAEKENVLAEVGGLLSVGAAAVPATVSAMVQRGREMEKELEEAKKTILDYEIEGRIRVARDSGEHVLVEVFDSLAPDHLKVAARKLSESSGKLTVCFSREPRFSAVIASPEGGADARVILSRIAARWGGRGGGTPGLAQLGSKEPLTVPDADAIAGIKEACMEVLAGAQ
jgi:alanyl-tRNA synthetase